MAGQYKHIYVCLYLQWTVSWMEALVMPTMLVAVQVNRKLLSSLLTLTKVKFMEQMVLLL